MVQQRAEGQPVPPGGGEVGDLHPAVVLGDLAAPGQQRLAGVGFPSQDRARDGAGLPRDRRKRRESVKFSLLKKQSWRVRPHNTLLASEIGLVLFGPRQINDHHKH